MSDSRFLKDSYVERNADETRAHYDAWAETYDQELAENHYATPAGSLKAVHALKLDPQAEILDVGCGTGLFARQLASSGFTIIDGCDYSPGMLQQAGETGLYRELFEANLNSPPLPAGGTALGSNLYDLASVVGVFSFGHVEAAAMDEIVRVVRPGGFVVIGLNDNFWNEGSLKAKLDDMEQVEAIEVVAVEPGDHLPGTGLSGWFISIRVS